jgi:hypothetical protein
MLLHRSDTVSGFDLHGPSVRWQRARTQDSGRSRARRRSIHPELRLPTGTVKVAWRLGARVFATGLLAVIALGMLDNAVTVRQRARTAELNEMAAVPGVQTASFVSAGLCAAVLLGIGMRLSSHRRPPLAWLWLLGGASVGFAYLVAMWTASLWV